MDPWTIGATALIPAPGTPPDALPELLKEQDATIFAAAPGVYRQMLSRCTRLDLPGLRHGLSAGEKLPRAIADRWQSVTGHPLYEAYGMSECSTFISHDPGAPVVTGTMGRPQKGRRVALLRNGDPVAVGEEGTIAVGRGDPGLMLCYFGDEAATQARMKGDWFLTGDQAIMRPNGQLVYMGRDDDMMNAGGFRVSPIEVENALSDHPGITAVAATTVEVKADTEVIAAFYTGPDALDDADLQTYVASRLARYKQPRLYIHVPRLPLGANGKILRRVLRRDFERPQ
jgi:acyl-coenzyme A synthetase/AMP-(fatty) acid ligase